MAEFQQRLQSSMGIEKGKWVWEGKSNQLLFQREGKASRKKSRVAWVTHGFAAAKITAERSDDTEDKTVTLEHVKGGEMSAAASTGRLPVAVGLISSELVKKMDKTTVSLFDDCYRTDEMNAFLWATLLYFDSFIQNTEAENDESASVQGILGDKARAVLTKTRCRLEQSKVNLGREYSYLILGIGQRERHHSEQGRLKASKTRTDQHLYEAVYEFAMYVTWVVFNYEHWKTLHNELGRIFRTMAFNRDCRFSSDDAYIHVDGMGDIDKTSDEYLSYRIYYDRPPVGTLNELKSPALVNYLPSPKERTPWVYQHPYKPSKSSTTLLPHIVKPPERLGVIGEVLSKLEPETLRYVQLSDSESDQDSNEEDGDDNESKVSGIVEDNGDGDSDCNTSP